MQVRLTFSHAGSFHRAVCTDAAISRHTSHFPYTSRQRENTENHQPRVRFIYGDGQHLSVILLVVCCTPLETAHLSNTQKVHNKITSIICRPKNTFAICITLDSEYQRPHIFLLRIPCLSHNKGLFRSLYFYVNNGTKQLHTLIYCLFLSCHNIYRMKVKCFIKKTSNKFYFYLVLFSV